MQLRKLSGSPSKSNRHNQRNLSLLQISSSSSSLGNSFRFFKNKMKSNVGKPTNLNNYDFDFGINTGTSNNRMRSLNGSLNDSKPKPASSSSTTSWNPNKPSWTHQPLPTQTPLQQPSSMVGDIFGKSWGSAAPGGAGTRIGIPEKDPNLFGDLLGSALGQGKSNSNVPLKNAAPVSNKNAAYSMGNLADSLPKTSSSLKNNTSNWGGSGDKLGSYSSINNNNNKTGNLGGSAMRGGVPASTTTKGPFVSLAGFGSKKEPTLNNANAAASKNVNSTSGDYSFGDFQNAATSSTPSTNKNSMGSHTASGSKTKSSGAFDTLIQDFGSQKQAPTQPQSKSNDPLGMFFSSSSASPAPSPGGSQAHESQAFSGVDDWGLGSQFGGDDNATTTELEGLPPPPAGMKAAAAKSKGMDNQKQGQHADAIKWLSWALVLLEKSGDTASTLEVLTCRASCFKEVGEYKKAVGDCSKVLEHEPENVSVLVQRALLYESTEKYRLGAADLRAVLKIDPGNRLARSTIHRLTQLAD